MSNEWLAAESSERTNNVLAAINAVSIHTKLQIAGTADDPDTRRIDEAKQCILAFLESLGQFIDQISDDEHGPVIGADPRSSVVAKRFVAAARSDQNKSPLYQLPLDRVKEIIASNGRDDPNELVLCLRDLRNLLEQDARPDANAVSGGLSA